MADVVPGSVSGTGRKIIVTAGVFITEGDWVYADSTDSSKMKPGSNAAVASAVIRGVALTAAVINGDVVVLLDGDYDPGVALVEGVLYVLSTGGAMAPVEDHTGLNGAGKYPTSLGRGTSAGTLRINFDIATTALA